MNNCNFCNNYSDRECARCEMPLCDDCDNGDWKDQESLCPDCKETKIEHIIKEQNKYFRTLEADLVLIKQNRVKILNYWEGDFINYMFLKKVIAMLDNLEWDITTVHLSSNDKRITNLIFENIDTFIKKGLRGIKDGK
jgi:hypothetical protein